MFRLSRKVILCVLLVVWTLPMGGCATFVPHATSQVIQPGARLDGANVVVIKASIITERAQQHEVTLRWAESKVMDAVQQLAEIWRGRGVSVKVTSINSEDKAKAMLAGKLLQLEVVNLSKELRKSSYGTTESLMGFRVWIMMFDPSSPSSVVWLSEMAVPAGKDDPVGYIVRELDGLLIKDKLVLER